MAGAGKRIPRACYSDLSALKARLSRERTIYVQLEPLKFKTSEFSLGKGLVLVEVDALEGHNLQALVN